MKNLILLILLSSALDSNAQIYQKISTWEERLNRFRVTGMFRPPLIPVATPDTGSLYYRASDSTYLGWTGNGYRPIKGGNADGGRVSADSLHLSTVNVYAIPDSLIVVGHSIAYGLNASLQSLAFADLYAEYLGIHMKNIAQSGRGMFIAAQSHNAYVDTGNTAATIIMGMLNDARRSGLSPATIAKDTNAIKAIFVNQNLKYWEPAGTGSHVARYGTWPSTSYQSSSVGGKGNSSGAYTQTTNDSIVYNSPVPTTNIAIGTIGADSSDGVSGFYNHSQFEVYIDGALKGLYRLNGNSDGINDGGNDNHRSPYVLIFTGLSNSPHSVKLVNKGNGYFPVDFFGHLVDTSQSRPFIIFDDPHLDATGYATAPANANDAIIDSFNRAAAQVLNNLPAGYRRFIVHTNNTYDVSTGLSLFDHIHPNDVGHDQIYQQALTDLPNIIDPGASSGTSFYIDRPYVVIGNKRKRYAFLEDEDFIRNRTTSIQPAGFRVSQESTVNNTFNTNVTKQGANIDPRSKAVTMGTLGATDIPYISLFNASGGANKKLIDEYYQDGSYVRRFISDGNTLSAMMFEVNGNCDSTVNFKIHSRHFFLDNVPFFNGDFLGVHNYDTLFVWDPSFKEAQRIKVNFANRNELADSMALLRTLIGNGVSDQAHTSGTSVTVSTGVTRLFVDPATALASLDITFPSSPADGQVIEMYFGGTISGSSLDVVTGGITSWSAPAGGFVPSPPISSTPIKAGTVFKFQYRASNNKWYQMK